MNGQLPALLKPGPLSTQYQMALQKHRNSSNDRITALSRIWHSTNIHHKMLLLHQPLHITDESQTMIMQAGNHTPSHRTIFKSPPQDIELFLFLLEIPNPPTHES